MLEPYSHNLKQRAGVQKLDDQLYGKLLETNAALKDAGGVLIIVYALVLLSTYLALWFGWYKSIWFLKGADLTSSGSISLFLSWCFLFGSHTSICCSGGAIGEAGPN